MRDIWTNVIGLAAPGIAGLVLVLYFNWRTWLKNRVVGDSRALSTSPGIA